MAAGPAAPQPRDLRQQPRLLPCHSPLWAGPVLPRCLPCTRAAIGWSRTEQSNRMRQQEPTQLACRGYCVLCWRLSSLPPPLLGSAHPFLGSAALLLVLQLCGLSPAGKRHLLWRIIVFSLVRCGCGGGARPHSLPSSPPWLAWRGRLGQPQLAETGRRKGSGPTLGAWVVALEVHSRDRAPGASVHTLKLGIYSGGYGLQILIAVQARQDGAQGTCTTDKFSTDVSDELSAETVAARLLKVVGWLSCQAA